MSDASTTPDWAEAPLEKPALAPVAEPERLVALDVLRGVAVLGILALNIQSFSMIGAAYMNPNAYGDLEGANRTVWYFTHLFGDQKFMSIFSMLFGAGVALMTSKAEAKGRSALGLHLRRMGLLIGFGFLHAHLLWYGDILWFYGWCGLLVYVFRKLPVPVLIVLAVVGMAIASGISLFFGWTMQFWGDEGVREFSDGGWLPVAKVVQPELDAYRGGWLSQAVHRTPTALFFEFLIPIIGGIGFKVLGLMLIGVALFRTGVITARRSALFYVVMAALGLGIGLPIVAWGVHQHDAHDWDVRYSFFFGGQYNFWASVIVALGYIGLVMLVCRLIPRALLLRPFAAAGRMAFTNYIAQTVICTTIFYGHGFGLFGVVERTGQIQIVVAIWIVQLIWSPIWLAFFRFGPMEWAWRSLSYWKRQPFLRSGPTRSSA
ncbi:MAG: DUF418 domain-containing protein [Planctomycetes bacterium]|nr:DUF418 domain-containing protein [Planctomycetota bacterium]